MTASDAGGGPEAFYPGFEEDARTWGLQTSAGITAGVVMGWVKGARGSAHLAGTYGQGNIYRGLFAEFRVPANFVQAALQSASWGWRVGIFTASFSALNIYLDRQRGALLGGGAERRAAVDPLTPSERAEAVAAGGAPFQAAAAAAAAGQGKVAPPGLESADLAMRVVPSAGAGALVGGSFGYLRQGGVRGTGLGLLLGMGLGGGLKGLEVAVDTLVKRVEAAERANGRPA